MDNSSIVSEEEWTMAIGKCFGNTVKFQVLDVSAEPLSYQLSGQVGDHLRIQVTIVTVDKPPQRHILKFFIKRVPLEDDIKSEFILSTGSFHKETVFYSKVVEHFKRYMTKGQLPWAPECYFTRPDVLVMEDLIDKGFTLFDKLQFMDYKHCEVVLQTIAGFHASSIVLEEKERELSKKMYKLNEIYPDIFVENMFVNSGSNKIKHWFQSSSKAVIALVPHLPNYGRNSKFYNEVMDKVSGTIDGILDLMKPSTKYRNVLCHGDIWTNNFLFRYGDDKKTPEEMRLVDFQMYRYTPPAMDVMACLHMTTSRAFRKQHEEALLRLYYGSMSRELLSNGYVAEQLLPWGDFRESCRFYGSSGRIAACLSFQQSKLPKVAVDELINSSGGQDVVLLQDKNKEVIQTFNTNPEYRQNVSDALEEMIEYDILHH